MPITPELDEEGYRREKAICDRAQAHAERIMRGGNLSEHRSRNYLTADEADHPDYKACNNEMRGRVEQYEVLTDPPEKLFAYIGTPKRNGMGIDRVVGQTYPVTTWPGNVLGYATRGSSWRVNSYLGSHMHQFYAKIAGREYTGRGFGEGMCIRLRETAASKRARQANETV